MEHKQQTNILPKSVSLVEEGDLLRELEAFPSSCSQLLIIYDYLCLSFYLKIETPTLSYHTKGEVSYQFTTKIKIFLPIGIVSIFEFESSV